MDSDVMSFFFYAELNLNPSWHHPPPGQLDTSTSQREGDGSQTDIEMGD